MIKLLSVGLTVASVLTASFISQGPIESANATTFSNCSSLNKKYPNGVASSATSVKVAQLSGYLKPNVSQSVYATSKNFGDPFNLGYSCVKLPKTPLGSVTVQTGWGYIKAYTVHRPQNGICVNVPLELDIRNASKVNSSMGITLRLLDDFDNVIGYQEWWGKNESQNAVNGKFASFMKVCKSNFKWTHYSGNRNEPVSGIGSGNWYWLNSYSWLGDSFQGASDYEFVK